MKSSVYLLIVLLFFKGALLKAQSCDSMEVCGCVSSDFSPSGMMIGHVHEKGTWKFAYRYMNTMMKNNLSGTEKIDDNAVFNNYIMSSQSMRMDMHMIMAMYGFSDKFSVMLMLNYNVLSMNMSALPGTMTMNAAAMSVTDANSDKMTTKTSGLGDTKLYAVYTLLNHNFHHLFLSAGLNIPSGNIRMKGAWDNLMYPGLRLPYMMQMGSGSLDFMPAVTYLLKKNKAAFSMQASSVIRPFNNSLNYHLGNEIAFNCWGAYKFLPWISASLRMEGNYSGSISGRDEQQRAVMEPAADAVNYGGENICSYAGVNFYLNRTFLNNSKFTIEYGMPVYQNVNGIQLAAVHTLYAGWLISF